MDLQRDEEIAEAILGREVHEQKQLKKKPLIPNSLSTLCWFWPETGFFDVCEVSGDTRARNKSLCTGLISTSSDIPNKSFGLLPPWKIEKRKYKNEDTSSMNGSSFK